MLKSTRDAVKAVLKSDPSLGANDRLRLLNAIKSGGEGIRVAKSETRLLRRAAVANKLGCTIRQVDNLARQGILRRVILPGRRRGAGFRLADVESLIHGGSHE
jgi:hypothetical protein